MKSKSVQHLLQLFYCFKDESIKRGGGGVSSSERSEFASISPKGETKITEYNSSINPSASSNITQMMRRRIFELKQMKSASEQEKLDDDDGRNDDQEESIIYFQEEGLYSVVGRNKRLQLELDNKIIIIKDYPSLPNSSLVISLVDQDLHQLEKPDGVYHDLLILLLQRNSCLRVIHSSFFDTMPDLRFLDMSDTDIRTLPSSLFNLPKLKVLLLRNCICLDTLPTKIGKLVHLEALDVSGAELYELPDEIGRLASITTMHLSFYGPGYERGYEDLPSRLVCASFLAELKKLRTLSISVHPRDRRWNEIVSDIVKDLSKLEDLSDLEFYFPVVETFEDFIGTSLSWVKLRKVRFNFIVGQNVKQIIPRVPHEVEQLFSQHERCLRYVNGYKVSPLLGSVLVHVTSFYLDHHTQARSLSDFNIPASNEVKFCVVRECPKIEVLLDEKTEFPSLEYLGIFYLWELKNIWKAETAMHWRNFEALKYLTVRNCHKIRFVLGKSMLRCLANLEELVVEDCVAVVKIIEEGKEEQMSSVELPRLRKVVLEYLPELVSLGRGVRLSEGTMISVCHCPKYAYIDTRTPQKEET